MPGIANKVYQSKKWHAVKEAYLSKRDYICERCGAPAVIVHHRDYLTAASMSDPEKAFAFDNLEALCQACHNKEHFGEKPYNPRSGMHFDADGNTVIESEKEHE